MKIGRALDGAVAVSGTARHSLGRELIEHFVKDNPTRSAISIDRLPFTQGATNRRIHSISIDLDPFSYGRQGMSIEDELLAALKNSQKVERFKGISEVVLSAGTYDCGSVAAMSEQATNRLLGVNVYGKLATLRSVLRLNQSSGFPSERFLTIGEIGALHPLFPSNNRAVYAASKSFGLGLSIALAQGREAERTIYFAPGPIDTHMLHRNHWVSKEGGPIQFMEQLMSRPGNEYTDVFVRCDDEVLAEVTVSRSDRDSLRDTFCRYKRRRANQFASPNGVLAPSVAASSILDILRDRDQGSGVYMITAPRGETYVRFFEYPHIYGGIGS